MTDTNFKIGDIIEICVINEVQGTGELLGVAYDHAYLRSWIVLILTRSTDFLMNKPEKAIIVTEQQMKKINTSYEIVLKDNHGAHCIKVPKIEISHLKEMTQEDAEILLCDIPDEDVLRLKKQITEAGKTDESILRLMNYFVDVDFLMNTENK